MTKIILAGLSVFWIGCHTGKKDISELQASPSEVKIAGAMRNVMWKGDLTATINLDSIADKTGLYGLGPEGRLTGELLINNGTSYVSRVVADSTMTVEKSFDASAPFFVYTRATQWSETEIPSTVRTIGELEKFIAQHTPNHDGPFVFKLTGKIANAVIHVQNLPKGTKISSPKDAHKGQVKYELAKQDAEIVGFYSTSHQGIFTHHDSYVHMHLITSDESKMGHLDELQIEKMKLHLPVD